MASYVFRRTLQAIPILLGVAVLVFLIVQLAPGEPIDRFRTGRVPVAAFDALVRLYGLDRPLLEQFTSWITAFVQVWRPDAWGYSFASGRPVLDVLLERAPATLRLTGAALIITILLAIPIGTLAAVKQYSWTDKIITTLATIGYAIPSFILGLYILYIGAVVLGRFPLFGVQSFGKEGDVGDLIWHLVLPVASLAIQQIAAWARFMRTSMLEVLHQDYVRTAKAKGLPRGRVLGKHALRNALIPIITLLGLSIPTLLGGAAITETIFSYAGLGSLFVESVALRDFPVILALTMVGAATVIIGNLVADILYGVIDPRIKY